MQSTHGQDLSSRGLARALGAIGAAAWLFVGCSGTIEEPGGFFTGGPGSMRGGDNGPNGSGGSGSTKDGRRPGNPGSEDPNGNEEDPNGSAGEGADNPLGPRPPAFSCDADALAPEQPLRRLSSSQYRNVLRDLITATVPAESPAILDALADPLSSLPRDIRSGPEPDYGGLRRLDQSIYAEAIDGTYKVALATGAALTSSSARLRAAAAATTTWPSIARRCRTIRSGPRITPTSSRCS